MGARETIRTAVRDVVPPAGLTRALAVQAMVYAVGTGLFQAGSAVFFTRALGLRPAQVGLGLSLAAGASLLGTVPLGGLTDRYGPQRVWIVCLLLDAALFAAYPFVGGFAGFLAVVIALAVRARRPAWPARSTRSTCSARRNGSPRWPTSAPR